MSDILIRGMEMPITCSQCPLCYDYMMCSLREGRFSHMGESFDCCEMRLADCPLVELPQHGDLIDRRELLSTVMQVVTKFPTNKIAAIEHLDFVSALLRGATVVVPAERRESND